MDDSKAGISGMRNPGDKGISTPGGIKSPMCDANAGLGGGSTPPTTTYKNTPDNPGKGGTVIEGPGQKNKM